jgi:hypothetical protein
VPIPRPIISPSRIKLCTLLPVIICAGGRFGLPLRCGDPSGCPSKLEPVAADLAKHTAARPIFEGESGGSAASFLIRPLSWRLARGSSSAESSASEMRVEPERGLDPRLSVLILVQAQSVPDCRRGKAPADPWPAGALKVNLS